MEQRAVEWAEDRIGGRGPKRGQRAVGGQGAAEGIEGRRGDLGMCRRQRAIKGTEGRWGTERMEGPHQDLLFFVKNCQLLQTF
jgi:hypothetical protein